MRKELEKIFCLLRCCVASMGSSLPRFRKSVLISFSRAVNCFRLRILILKDWKATVTPIVCKNYQMSLRDITEDRDVARQR
jgi:hypothetical protein